jgi:UDP-glucose:(heptosyl)LPS alpha-1,3-glucosyltransferase
MVAAEIQRHFKIAAGKLHVIYNGVDLEYFNPQKRREIRGAARSDFGCKDGDRVFSFVGSGFARKGLTAAIDALASSGRRDFRLLVAGRDRATARFAAYADRAGVAEQVKFLGGIEDVRPVYAASDCFILPTRYDPFPNAALEALAMGVPVIVSRQCGAAEIVDPGRNGWICAPDSPDSLARLMIEAAGMSGEGVADAARCTAEGYGIERMADRMVELYGTLLRGRPSGAAGGA